MSEEQQSLPDSEGATLVDKQIEELQKITDYEIKEWPIGVLVEKFTNGRETDESEIFIPDYQREMVWTPRQQSRFIESILIKLPVPFIFAADVGQGDREGSLEIIDGSQRIRTLDNFLSNKLELVGLKRLTHANGMKFSDLEHVLNHANNIRQVRQHQHGKRHVMQSSQRLRQLLVSSGQTPEASSPAKAALNYPAARQQHKATLGFWQLHHVQLYAMFASFIGGSVAGIALINKGDFD